MTTATSFTAESAALPTTRQDDLSDAYMDGGPAPLWPFFQGLGNAKAMNESALINAISWSGDVSIAPGQAANNFDITVGAINAVCLYNGTIYKVFSSSGATVTEAKVEGGGGTLGAAAAWWYLYCYNNGGTLDYEVSTTAPNANRVAKSGDATRRYLGCFRTTSAGAPIPMHATNGRVLYRRSGLSTAYDTFASNGLRAADNTGSVSLTALSLAARVPPHARIALLRGTVTMGPSSPAADASAALRFYTADDTSTHAVEVKAQTSASTDATAQGDAELITTSSQAVGYSVVLTSAVASHAIDVLGWVE